MARVDRADRVDRAERVEEIVPGVAVAAEVTVVVLEVAVVSYFFRLSIICYVLIITARKNYLRSER